MHMSAGKMHVDEVDTHVSFVVRLLTAQFPQWADFPSCRNPGSIPRSTAGWLGAFKQGKQNYE